jgi:hypothetical protein
VTRTFDDALQEAARFAQSLPFIIAPIPQPVRVRLVCSTTAPWITDWARRTVDAFMTPRGPGQPFVVRQLRAVLPQWITIEEPLEDVWPATSRHIIVAEPIDVVAEGG